VVRIVAKLTCETTQESWFDCQNGHTRIYFPKRPGRIWGPPSL